MISCIVCYIIVVISTNIVHRPRRGCGAGAPAPRHPGTPAQACPECRRRAPTLNTAATHTLRTLAEPGRLADAGLPGWRAAWVVGAHPIQQIRRKLSHRFLPSGPHSPRDIHPITAHETHAKVTPRQACTANLAAAGPLVDSDGGRGAGSRPAARPDCCCHWLTAAPTEPPGGSRLPLWQPMRLRRPQ